MVGRPPPPKGPLLPADCNNTDEREGEGERDVGDVGVLARLALDVRNGRSGEYEVGVLARLENARTGGE